MSKTDAAESLERRIEELEAQRKRDREVLENFIAKFGTYYNSANRPSLFIVDRLVKDGADGLVQSAQQGVFERFSVPIKAKPLRDEDVRPTEYWVPLLIPERTEEAVVELFGGSDGADSKTSS